jgi:hypothetical protein
MIAPVYQMFLVDLAVMGSHYSDTSSRRSARRRRRKGAGLRLALIAVMGIVAFGVGFFALWSLGGWVRDRDFFTGSDGDQDEAPAILPAADYELPPLYDVLTFRDLSYVPVKGIHLTPNAAGTARYLTPRIEMADTTEINAFVIDLKDDTGNISYECDVPLVQAYGTVNNLIGDMETLIATLYEHGITPIARIVCFKDDVLSQKQPELAIQSTEGGLWADSAGHYYLNPYDPDVWEYLVQVAEDAARLGFREIQFDYVRFPTDGNVELASYPGKYCSKNDVIAGFLEYAGARLEEMGVWVSADVFGLVVHTPYGGDRFGQNLEKICRHVDIVCPMIYPSHYWSGDYGLDDPNANPVTIVTYATEDMARRLPGTGAKGRPYIQDFEWGDMAYGPETMQGQLAAAEEQGFDEWILWGPFRESTVSALDPD